jgi:hypothetical protein
MEDIGDMGAIAIAIAFTLTLTLTFAFLPVYRPHSGVHRRTSPRRGLLEKRLPSALVLSR